MRLTVFPYVASDISFYPEGGKPIKFFNPINEEYFDIKGFELEDDGTLSFVMAFVDGKYVKRAATLKLDASQRYQLRRVLDGYKFPQG
jgi:hypothetical protein